MLRGVSRDSDASKSINCETSEERHGNQSPEFSFFDSLPIEVFLHICSFLEVKDMVLTLSRVCRRFHEILGDENIWKCWVARRFCSRYPIIPIESEGFDWRGACLDIEREWKLWSDKDEKLTYVNVNDVHISSCDAIVFCKNGSICITGSRDRSLAVWNPVLVNQRRRPCVHYQVAHDGWIWRLMEFQNNVYSCSWDNTVKSWSIDSSNLQPVSTFVCSSPVLAMTSLNGLLVAGDYGKTVYGFDPRVCTKPQFTYAAHQRAVLTLGANDTDIISGSEDKTIAVWDSRNRSLKQRITLGKVAHPITSYSDGYNLYVGDNKGAVHVFSTKNGEVYFVNNVEMNHARGISAIKCGRGYLVTGSFDGTVKICLPTQPPQVVTTIRSSGKEVSGLDYCNGMLVSGSGCCVEFWIPKESSNL